MGVTHCRVTVGWQTLEGIDDGDAKRLDFELAFVVQCPYPRERNPWFDSCSRGQMLGVVENSHARDPPRSGCCDASNQAHRVMVLVLVVDAAAAAVAAASVVSVTVSVVYSTDAGISYVKDHSRSHCQNGRPTILQCAASRSVLFSRRRVLSGAEVDNCRDFPEP